MSFDKLKFWRKNADGAEDDGYSELLSPIVPVDEIAGVEEPSDVIELRPKRQPLALKIPNVRLKVNRRAVYAVVIVGLLAISIIFGAMSGSSNNKTAVLSAQTDSTPQQSGSNEIKIKAPSGIDQLQGTKSALDTRQYTDNFYGANVNVTIQQLPDNFRTDPNALTTLATSLKATQKLQTSKWGTAYMLTSGDVQVIVFANQSNLVILQSMAKHTAVEWIPYIDGIGN